MTKDDQLLEWAVRELRQILAELDERQAGSTATLHLAWAIDLLQEQASTISHVREAG